MSVVRTPVEAGLRALIFDFDGTLAETERDGHRVAYNRAFADLNLSWEWTDARYAELLAVAGGKERIVHYLEADDPPRPAGPVDRLVHDVHERKVARFAELAPSIALRPGVARVVAAARAAGVRLAVATTASESGVRAVLGRSPETLAAFEIIAAGDVVARKKPAPDVYLYVLERLGVSPAAALAVEDSAIGLAAARAAGLRTLVTPSVYTRDEPFAAAAAVLSGLGDPGDPAQTLAGPPLSDGMADLNYLSALVR